MRSARSATAGRRFATGSPTQTRADVGHRVAGAFSSHEARLWGNYNSWRVSPRGAGPSSDNSLHTIVRRDGDHWVVFFDHTSWGEPYGSRATFRLGSDDSFILTTSP